MKDKGNNKLGSSAFLFSKELTCVSFLRYTASKQNLVLLQSSKYTQPSTGVTHKPEVTKFSNQTKRGRYMQALALPFIKPWAEQRHPSPNLSSLLSFHIYSECYIPTTGFPGSSAPMASETRGPFVRCADCPEGSRQEDTTQVSHLQSSSLSSTSTTLSMPTALKA